jgi:hypothetical protein
VLHPDQALFEKVHKKGKLQRILNDHEQARLDSAEVAAASTRNPAFP